MMIIIVDPVIHPGVMMRGNGRKIEERGKKTSGQEAAVVTMRVELLAGVVEGTMHHEAAVAVAAVLVVRVVVMVMPVVVVVVPAVVVAAIDIMKEIEIGTLVVLLRHPR